MSTDFTPDWPHGHVTRDGLPARIICRDRKSSGASPIVALIDFGHDEIAEHFTATGQAFTGENRAIDLLNAPAPKKVWEGWAVLLPSGKFHTFENEARAKNFIDESDGWITPVRIEFPSGDGP